MSGSAKMCPLTNPWRQSTSRSSGALAARASVMAVTLPARSEEDAQVLRQHDVLVQDDRAPRHLPVGGAPPEQVVALPGPEVDLTGEAVPIAEEVRTDLVVAVGALG